LQKRRNIRNFYVDETFEPVWDEFRLICLREGESASQKIREFIERYVMVHSEGNPQLLIEKFMKDLPQKECYHCKGHSTPLFKVKYISGLIAPTCQSCLNREREKGPYSTVKRVLGVI
jgi:hypothetical protein